MFLWKRVLLFISGSCQTTLRGSGQITVFLPMMQKRTDVLARALVYPVPLPLSRGAVSLTPSILPTPHFAIDLMIGTSSLPGFVRWYS